PWRGSAAPSEAAGKPPGNLPNPDVRYTLRDRVADRLARSGHGVGDARQQVLEDFQLLGPKGVIDLPETAFPAIPKLLLNFPPLRHQINAASAAVMRVTLAANELLLFQPGQHFANGIRVGESALDHFALRQAVFLGQQRQHDEL